MKIKNDYMELGGNDFSMFSIMYGHSSRHYHDLNHIEDMYKTHLDIEGADNKAIVLLAALYHDIIYDPLSKTNEENSITFFECTSDWPMQPSIVIQDCIYATKHLHKIHNKKIEKYDNNDERLVRHFCDLDLNGVGASREQFEINYVNIRKEYSQVENKEWLEGRINFWKAILDRGYIYNNPYNCKYFKDREDQARQNIDNELQWLDKCLRFNYVFERSTSDEKTY